MEWVRARVRGRALPRARGVLRPRRSGCRATRTWSPQRRPPASPCTWRVPGTSRT